jgi:hypothetical protein
MPDQINASDDDTPTKRGPTADAAAALSEYRRALRAAGGEWFRGLLSVPATEALHELLAHRVYKHKLDAVEHALILARDIALRKPGWTDLAKANLIGPPVKKRRG